MGIANRVSMRKRNEQFSEFIEPFNKALKNYKILITVVALILGFVTTSYYLTAHQVKFPIGLDFYLLSIAQSLIIFFTISVLFLLLISPSIIIRWFNKDFKQFKKWSSIKHKNKIKSITAYFFLLVTPLISVTRAVSDNSGFNSLLILVTLLLLLFVMVRNKKIEQKKFVIYLTALLSVFIVWFLIMFEIFNIITKDSSDKHIEISVIVFLTGLFYLLIINKPKKDSISRFIPSVVIMQIGFSFIAVSSVFFGGLSLKVLGIGGGIEKEIFLTEIAKNNIPAQYVKHLLGGKPLYLILETNDAYHLKYRHSSNEAPMTIKKSDIALILGIPKKS